MASLKRTLRSPFAVIWLVPWLAQAQVPPGFEELMEPQLTVVDVFLGDRPLGSVPAVTTPEWIQFESPAELLDLVDALRPTHREAVENALTGRLPVNSAHSCFPTPTPNCRQVSFIDAAVVYEPAIFRVDLLIESKHLEVQYINLERFLPPPSSGFSNLLSLNGTLNGRNRELSYGTSIRNYLSYGENHLYSNVSVSDGRGAQFENLTAQRTSRRSRLQGGFFPLQELDVIAGFELLGAGLGSTNQLRLDLRQVQGTELVVYLAQRSRVTIFKDGQLLTAGFYEAGNQTLDTRILPLGAYFVTLEIEDARGNIETQTRFFTKSTRLPPFDSPNYWLAAGTLVNDGVDRLFPEVSDTYTLGGGLETRFTDSLALSGDLLASVEQVVGEFGIVYQLQEFELITDTILTVDGFAGHSLSLLGQSDRIGVAVNWRGVRRFWGRNESDVAANIPLEDLLGGGAQKFVDRDSVQLSARLSYRFSETQASVFGSLAGTEGFRDSYSIGLETNTLLVRRDTFLVQLVASLTNTQDRTVGLVNISFLDNSDRWSMIGSAGQQYEDFDGRTEVEPITLTGSSRIAWNDRDLFPDERLGASWASDYRGDIPSQRLDADYESSYGRVLASSAYSPDLLSYSLSASTSVLASENGIAAGGRDRSSSGIVLEVTTDDDEATFDILVNQSKWGTIRANETVPLVLPPYRRYRVQVTSNSDAFINIDKGDRQVILYPGNVAFLSFETKRISVVIGTLLDGKGDPLAGQLVSSSEESSRTDESGFFQLTARDGEPLTVGELCTVPVLTPATNGVVVLEEPIVCSTDTP